MKRFNIISRLCIVLIISLGCIDCSQKERARNNPYDPGNPSNDYYVLPSHLNASYWGNNYKLSSANSPYSVTGNVTLGIKGDSIMIDSGVTIKFSGSYSFSAIGNVIANGTSASPIKFTSGRTTPGSGDYGDISIGYDSYDGRVTLNYVIFEYGSRQYIYGDSSSKVTNCIFANNNSQSPSLSLRGEVKNCNFQRTGSESIYIAGGPIISYCNISGGVYMSRTAWEYKINYCNLTKGSAPVLTLTSSYYYQIDVTNNWWGTTNSSTIASYISSSVGSVSYSPYASSSISGTGPQ